MYGNNTKIDATISVSLPPVIHSNPIKEKAKKSSSRPHASKVCRVELVCIKQGIVGSTVMISCADIGGILSNNKKGKTRNKEK